MSVSNGKIKKLLLGLLFDGIGMISLLMPGVGPALDLLWAPVSAWLITRMYPGRAGKAAGFIAFIEEVLPGTDIVPTFTLMWIYTFFIQKADIKETARG